MGAATKNFQLLVNNPPTPIVAPDFYWTYDEASGGRLDSVSGIVQAPGNELPSAPGLYGLSLVFDGTATSGIIGTPNLTSPDIISVANGWSMCGWFKVNSWSIGVYDSDVQIRGMAVSTNWRTFLEFNSTTSMVHFHSENQTDFFDPVEFSPTLGTWYFFHIFYDPIIQRVGYTINLGAPVYDSHTGIVYGGGLNSGDPYFFDCSQIIGTATAGNYQVDEVLWRLGAKFTDEEITYLFNAGIGRTWPL